MAWSFRFFAISCPPFLPVFAWLGVSALCAVPVFFREPCFPLDRIPNGLGCGYEALTVTLGADSVAPVHFGILDLQRSVRDETLCWTDRIRGPPHQASMPLVEGGCEPRMRTVFVKPSSDLPPLSVLPYLVRSGLCIRAGVAIRCPSAASKNSSTPRILTVRSNES